MPTAARANIFQFLVSLRGGTFVWGLEMIAFVDAPVMIAHALHHQGHSTDALEPVSVDNPLKWAIRVEPSTRWSS